MTVIISIKDYSESDPVVFENEDAVYWYLYPFFESLWSETGQMIDLHSAACFEGGQLLALAQELRNAEVQARKHDGTWEVTVGDQSDGQPIKKPVSRADVLRRIVMLKELASNAYDLDRELVCAAD